MLQLGNSDLTFDDVAVATPLVSAPARIRHKRQLWDSWGDDDADTADYDNYDEEDDYNDYNGGDYDDYNGGDGGTTASGDGLPPTEPTMPTDDEDLLVEGSGPTPSVIEPRTGPRPTRPLPTAPTGLGECR